MNDIKLLPVNLGEFGVVRATPNDVPDLITIAMTPYPVLAKYKALCKDISVIPFAGGSWKKQGAKNRIGYITSGYRSAALEGRINSPHRFAFALDIAVGHIQRQIKWAKCAVHLYTRIGLYPDNGFIHVDLAPLIWIKKYKGKRYWCKINGVYRSFMKFKDMLDYALNNSQEGD